MADKKSIFDKYKSVDENGEIVNNPVEENEQIPQETANETDVVETPDVDNSFSYDYTFKDDEYDEIDEILKSVSLKESVDVVTEVEEETVPQVPEVETEVEEDVATEEVVDEATVVVETPEEAENPKGKKKKEPKEKKVKEPKQKKEKKSKQPKEEEETAEPEPVTGKDIFSIVLAIIALIMALGVIMVKFFPDTVAKIFPNGSTQAVEETTEVSEQEIASIQVFRDGYLSNLVQSDIPNVFYQFSQDYSIQFYQYRDNKMVPVKTMGTVSAKVDYGAAEIPVKIEYVQVGDQVFGVGLYRADQHPDIPIYNIKSILFKMTNLPVGYTSEGKALLVSKIVKDVSIESDYNEWAEAFSVDMNTGKTTRFLKIINRDTDPTTGTYAEDFCILTTAGYKSTSGQIPFFTARDYDVGVEKEDIYVKNGSGESLLIRNASRRLLVVDGKAVIFMRTTDTGFNILRKENGTESLVFKFTGEFNKCMFDGEYILDKEKATLYNIRTKEEKLVLGYKMTQPEYMKVSPDGRYLIVMGTMDNVMDYQVHVFDLQTGKFAKYIEKNYSTILGHTKNLSFIDDHTVMYMLIDPNRGRECVVLDLAKAFE